MDVNELRIGNYLTISKKQRNELWYNEISAKNDHFKVDTIWSDNDITLELDDEVVDFEIKNVNPIMLTEEWLFKFGFKKLGDGYDAWESSIYSLEYIRNHWHLLYKSNEVISTPFKYVHQLQNIFFALTSEELQLKSES